VLRRIKCQDRSGPEVAMHLYASGDQRECRGSYLVETFTELFRPNGTLTDAWLPGGARAPRWGELLPRCEHGTMAALWLAKSMPNGTDVTWHRLGSWQSFHQIEASVTHV